ncbi:ABC transporter ATP-binding protein [Candidatus Bathyarchaeota archaeon]|nr:ABC transporter ATP-binding protein [Candidatus Bathyarchaeota archaeon]
MSQQKVIISVRNLTVEFRVPRGILRAVDGLDLDVYEGEVLGLVGESGCGKSVFAHALLKLVDINGYIKSGKVIFDGTKDVYSLGKKELREYRWKDVALIFQGAFNSLNPVMKVFDHMVDTVLAHEKNVSSEEIKKRSIELLKMVRLDPETVLGRYPHELSGGMKQRTVSAMALLLRPKVLILDEPTSALDVLTQKFFIRILKDLRKEFGLTMIFITHDLATVAEIADRVAIMYGGTIVEIGNVEDIFYRSRHPYTRALLNAIPSIVGDISKLKPLPGPLPDPVNPPPGCGFHPRCPYAIQICREVRPELERIDAVSFVACHRWRELKFD